MTPQCEVIDKSEVLQAIKEEQKTDAKKTLSKFLQQPDRPVVKPKQEPSQIVNSYKPIIKIPRKGQQTVESTEPQEKYEIDQLTTQKETGDQSAIETETQQENNTPQSDSAHNQSSYEETTHLEDKELQIEQTSEEQIRNETLQISTEEFIAPDKNDIDAQLLKINEQLANLMCMPQEMQRYLLEVKDQIAHIIQIKTENQDVEKEENITEHQEVESRAELKETDSAKQPTNEESPNTEEESSLSTPHSSDQLLTAEEPPAEDPPAEDPPAKEPPAMGDNACQGAQVSDDTFVADPPTQDNQEQEEEKKLLRDIKWQKEAPVKNRPFFPLTPKPRPIVVPGDVCSIANEGMFSEDFIAETLTGNAEVIFGRTIGNNFLKFKKNYDHLQLSSVYKMVHQDDKSFFPSRGKLPSEGDCIQSVKKANI